MLRILKKTGVNGSELYIIQNKNWRGKWVDADAPPFLPSAIAPYHHRQDIFPTLESAQKNLCWFNGSKPVYEIVG